MFKTILEIKNLEKSFSKNKILNNINLKIENGSILGILGKNGAGKTILIDHLIGLIKPDSGCITFINRNIEEDISNYKDKINFASGYQSLQVQSTVIENLKTFAGLYGLKNINAEVERVLNLLNIDIKKFGNKKILKCSSGEISKAVLAKSLLNKPKILFLDEPLVFLDPIYKTVIIKLLKKINKEEKTTIVFTSHQLDEITELCSDVAILREGEISFMGKIKNKEDLIQYY